MTAPPPLLGRVRVPGDKSVTHRALMLGAVAEGTTVVNGALWAADTRASAGCLEALGAGVQRDGARLTITGREHLGSARAPLDCANAGTTARLLTGLLAGRRGSWTLDGDDSLRARPMDRVVQPLRALGARLSGSRLPLSIEGAPLRGGTLTVDVPSAQVKSALLLAGLVADGPLTVLQHAPTRDHTELMLPRFGIQLEAAPGALTVHPGRPRATTLDVPGDPSAAAFLLAAGCLVPGSDVWVTDVGLWPRRTGFLRALERAGADVMVLARRLRDGDPLGDVRAGASELTGFDIAPEDVPDLVDELPILALLAARARGTSRFAGLAELRLKESDRVDGIARLLAAMDVAVDVHDDGLTITGSARLAPPPPEAFSHADHRLAMTAAVGALAAGVPLPAALPAADVSFPGFLDLLRTLPRAS